MSWESDAREQYELQEQGLIGEAPLTEQEILQRALSLAVEADDTAAAEVIQKHLEASTKSPVVERIGRRAGYIMGRGAGYFVKGIEYTYRNPLTRGISVGFNNTRENKDS
jgi:predicted nucleic acid-binding protein